MRPIPLVFGLAAALLAFGAFAQPSAGWPVKPVRWVVPYAPGGPTDAVSRVLAPKLAERIGQPVIIENRVGAAGNVGTDSVVKAAPDGHTLAYVVPAVIANPYFLKASPDPKDLAPVTQVVNVSMVMLASTAFAPKTVAEIIATARAKPGTVSCGSAGGVPTVACELLRLNARAELIMVMYKGQGPALNALMAGEINLLFDGVGTALAAVRSGRARALASLGSRRGAGTFADLPLVSETIPGFEFSIWHGVMAPAATPRDVVLRINRAITSALAQPEVAQRLSEAGFEVVGSSVEAFEEMFRAEAAKYAKVLKEAGVRPE